MQSNVLSEDFINSLFMTAKSSIQSFKVMFSYTSKPLADMPGGLMFSWMSACNCDKTFTWPQGWTD